MATACASVGIWEAVWVWLQGSKLDGYCIFGLSTVWIGRAAKIASFLSAMTIIIDIMGEQKIHAIGISVNRLAFSTGEGIRKLVAGMGENFDRKDGLRIDAPGDVYVFMAGTVVAIIGELILATWVWHHFDLGYLWLPFVVFLLIMLPIFTMPGAIYVMALLSIIGFIVRQVEKILARPDLCRRLRILAASVFVVSFLIDLSMS